MCLDYQKLRTFKKNDNVRIGYKYFYKVQEPGTGKWYYHNLHYDSYKQHSLGEWCSIDKNKFIKINFYLRINEKCKKYKSGFHFLDEHNLKDNSLTCVECICENITATGTQFGKKAFVAQNYRLMREV